MYSVYTIFNFSRYIRFFPAALKYAKISQLSLIPTKLKIK